MKIKVDNLSHSYDGKAKVLDDITCTFNEGITAIFGPNGSGKSTLLRCLNGSIQPTQGSVDIGSKKISELAVKDVARMVSVVPQDTAVNIPFTVYQMVMLGRYPYSSLFAGFNGDDEPIVWQALEQMGIAELADRQFSSLSGGERQRVVLARAIAQQADVMLFDEPDTHLDISHQLELYDIMEQLKAQGKNVILVSHNIFISPMFIDNAVLLGKGCIVAAGHKEEVLTKDNIAKVFGVDIDINRTGSRSFCCTLL